MHAQGDLLTPDTSRFSVALQGNVHSHVLVQTGNEQTVLDFMLKDNNSCYY